MDRHGHIVGVLVGAVVVVLLCWAADSLVLAELGRQRTDFRFAVLAVVLVLAAIWLVDRLAHSYFEILRAQNAAVASSHQTLLQEREVFLRVLKDFDAHLIDMRRATATVPQQDRTAATTHGIKNDQPHVVASTRANGRQKSA